MYMYLYICTPTFVHSEFVTINFIMFRLGKLRRGDQIMSVNGEVSDYVPTHI